MYLSVYDMNGAVYAQLISPTDSTDTCAGEGRVKLVGGSHEFEGDVLICQNGEWRYFCIFVLGIHWTEHHGRVVCRSLGFSTEGKLYTYIFV